MAERELEELLFSLDFCADALPFDLQPVHVLRLQTIKAILIERVREQKERPRREPPKLSAVVMPFEQRPR